MKHSTIVIIGAGAVGSTIAYALMLKNIVSEIVLIDIDAVRCAGEVKDLSDSLVFSFTSNIYQGTYADAKNADIIIIAAGRSQKPGQTRIELVDTNIRIFKSILNNLEGLNSDALMLIVANPLDLLTLYAHKYFKLPAARMFGTGTFIDSQRLKHLLACDLKVSQDSIQAFVIGEHGDSQAIVWSATIVGGMCVDQWGITSEKKELMASTVKNEAYDIIKAKGATYYGIAACVAMLCEIIIFDKKMIVPLSWYHEKYEVSLSLPVVLGRNGIERVVDLNLTHDEQRQLNASAALLKKYMQSLQAY